MHINTPATKKKARLKTTARHLLLALLSLATALGAAWIFGALYYDGPGTAAGGWNLLLAFLWLTSSIIIAVKLRMARLWQIRLILCCLPVYVYWLSIRPSNDRDWQDEFAETGYVEINGDTLTFHNIRNFDYIADGSETGIVTQRWETRTHHLSQLQGVDLIIDAFGGDLMAHTMLTFDFGKEGRLTLSIETRREKNESFSALGGIYKMFELQYIFGDEADLAKVRTNIRDEPLYLYRTKSSPEMSKTLLLECISAQNKLKSHPRWYNAVTHNCTTSYRAQTPVDRRTHFDWRMLVNGQIDKMLYNKGAFVTDGLTFEELRKQALINDVATTHPEAKKFSEAIRKNRAGFK